MLEKACKIGNCTCNQMLSVGDRYDIDLALPLEMGMGAVLTNGAEDVIKLTESLKTAF